MEKESILAVFVLVFILIFSLTSFNIITGFVSSDLNECDLTHKIQICHVPQDSIEDSKILCVDANGWNGHNNHEKDIYPITDLSNNGFLGDEDCVIAASNNTEEQNITNPENNTEEQDNNTETVCLDQDNDTFTDLACGGTDCNDNHKDVNPNSIELCDGLDNDCDSLIDESLTESCEGDNIGICSPGMRTCNNGQWSECLNKIEPQQEVCNNLDDDCNNEIDDTLNCTCLEGETKVCSSNIGICKEGTQTCLNNEFTNCTGVLPQQEVCDSLDNDCNGQIDENACSTSSSGGGSGGGGSSSKGETKEFKKEVINTAHTSKGSSGFKVDIVNLPERIDISDKRFVMQAEFQNTGSTDINNINTVIETNGIWSSDGANIETLKANETKVVDIIFESDLCKSDLKKSTTKIDNKQLIMDIQSSSEQHKIKQNIVVHLNIPKLSASTSVIDSTNKIKTCLFISNPEAKQKEAEIEFEIDNELDDLLFDYITPIKLEKNQVLLKEEIYTLKSVPEPGYYEVRASLYEDGKLFMKGYSVAHTSSIIDLTNFKNNSLYSKLSIKIKNIFRR